MTILTIHVKPRSSRDDVKKIGTNEFEVSTVAAPEEGRANDQVMKLLARYFNTSPSKLVVTKGERWNDKTILLMD
ncbi:hypothetical protein C5B42_00035 [Candidatus Cerribacteria bacterium 'Amazon FNV 2010 28 9']|uniref:Uncharacterized protein n=1 Tax=Candidatus Cerribacteria bacterium 'Amazon FNV 2010 28 9' TaxID=2081795 RepID=A0A317JVJ0_9BACT|nr:MAG: hypothetical protein C5B42_00035 [Candidatus Cerribacteria bacterium 'Amazon FNV 2010 28 9']